jgi:hypothetical protein
LGVTFSGARMIGSIMSAGDTARASDDDLINAFRQLPDSTMWSHPERLGEGWEYPARAGVREFR